MNRSRLLTIATLLVVVFALGLSAARAQEPPAKVNSPAAGVPRPEGALSPGMALPALAETEPNDSRDSASRIDQTDRFAMQASGAINNGSDTDYFEFFGVPGDEVHVSVAASRYGSALDAVVYLYRGNNTTPLATSDDCGTGDLDPCLTYTLTAEAYYYLRVVDFWGNGGANYWYDLFLWMPARDNDGWSVYNTPGDEEPNNTRATATQTAYGFATPGTRMNVSGDIDYFKFEGKQRDVARIKVESTGLHTTLAAQVGLYNSANKLLASCGPASWLPNTTNCLLEKELPKSGIYYIKVTDAQGNSGPGTNYWLQLGIYENDEPNDRFYDATELNLGASQRGQVSAGDRCDYYSFSGYEGTYLTALAVDQTVTVYDNAGDYLYGNYFEWGLPISAYLPYTGTYYVRVCAFLFTSDIPLEQGVYNLTLDSIALAGMKANGKVGSPSYTVDYARGDILAFRPYTAEWAMFLDGSDVGVTGNLMDFALISRQSDEAMVPGSILAALGATATLPAYPTPFKAQPHDIVAFEPWSLGDDTRGDWSMFFDGSIIGLTTTAERIDAVEWDGWYPALVFSTVGTATINSDAGPLTAQDEDLVGCETVGSGANLEVYCYLFFDGSAAGLPAAADIASVWQDSDWSYYMTFAAKTVVDGRAYKPSEVVICHPDNIYPTTSCTWERSYWPTEFGLGGRYVDGLHLMR